MEIISVFIANLLLSDWLALAALLISIASFCFSYISYKSRERVDKMQMMLEISENLNRARWEIFNALELVQDCNNILIKSNSGRDFSKHISEFKGILSQTDEHRRVFRDLLEAGFTKIEYKKLFAIKNYAKSTHINYESVRKNLTPDIKDLKMSMEQDVQNQRDQDKVKARQDFFTIRDIPYSIPLMYGEVDHCCSGKNKMLKEVLEALRYQVRWRVCTFRWSSIDLPEEITAAPHDNNSTHAYLEFLVENEWRAVDATWDKGLEPIFSIEEWDGVSATGVAVKPVEVYSPKKSQEIMNDDSKETIELDLAINEKFYKAFNDWLVEIRKSNNNL